MNGYVVAYLDNEDAGYISAVKEETMNALEWGPLHISESISRLGSFQPPTQHTSLVTTIVAPPLIAKSDAQTRWTMSPIQRLAKL